MPDGFVRGKLLDLDDGGLGPASQVLHCQWPEGHPSSTHCVPHLVLFPPVSFIGRVARFLRSTIDDIVLEGSCDGHVKAQVLTIVASKRDQQVRWTPVQARKEEWSLPFWVVASGLGKPDKPLS